MAEKDLQAEMEKVNALRDSGVQFSITPDGRMTSDKPFFAEVADKGLESLAGAAGGLVAGGGVALGGLPGDLVGIVDGIYESIVAEDGERLDAFLNTLVGHSEAYGSEALRPLAISAIDSMPGNEQVKETMRLGLEIGEIYGIPTGLGAAYQGAKKVPGVLRKVDEAGQAAQTRLDEQGGPRLMSGIDPVQAKDELVAGAGQVARAVLPKKTIITEELAAAILPDKRMSMQPPEVLAGLSTGARAAIKQLAAEKRASQTVEPGLDDMDILTGDEVIRALGPKMDEVSDRDQLKQVLDIRSQQMELKPADRLQPSGEDPLFDTSEAGYAANMPEQTVTPVPRAPEGVKLPKGNRASGVVEKTEEIAQRLAERMKPYLGTPAQYFYNTGPIIAKAVDLGIPEETAREQLKKFALNYAATSPRTMTEQNLRNASLVSAKQSQEIPIDEIVGGGGAGINEKGYPMMIGPSGIHRKLIDAAAADGIDVNTNPKPATFAENVMGNLNGVTVDTHAVRGALDAMNEIEPGSIPEGFILPEFRAQYKADPSSFDPAKMVDDTMASQKIDGVSMQTEYAVFSDLYRRAGEILGVSPAEAQSLGWFGSGDRTGLGSELKTVVDLIDDRVDVTAKALGKTKDEVFVGFMSGKIPLLSVGGLTLMETGSMMEEAQDGNL